MKNSHLVTFNARQGLKLLGACFLLVALGSCREFIEPALESKKVNLLAPGDRSESGAYTQKFWWEGIDGALSYRLQVVEPSFDSLSRLIVDTLVKSDQFTFILEPGRYEWRVRAENGSSRSAYTSRKFTIRLSTLSIQQVQLASPPNNTVTHAESVPYRWEKLYAATRYRLQVDTANFGDEGKLVLNTTTPNADYSFTFAKERVYRWRVRAENDTAQSKWSVVNSVAFDKTPPDAVALSSPANNQLVTKPVSLQWSGTAGAKQYEVMVLKSDSATVVNNTFPVLVTATSYSFTPGDVNEKFYWKVRAIDEAGNMGAYSEVRSFTVQ